MRRSDSPRRMPRWMAATLLAALAAPAAADPRDEAYWRTFYLTPIGAWGDERPVEAGPDFAAYPRGIGNVAEYRESMLALTGGVEPLNIRVGISNQIQFLNATHGAYYNWHYEPNLGFDFHVLLREALRHDVPFGVHMNGQPWADSPFQAEDRLGNHLEQLDGGAYLARNRNGLFRRGEQDPTRDESYDGFAPMLEMQLTLSANAQPVREALGRNLRIAARILAWYREQHPDLFIYNSASSEYAQHNLDSEWFDYGPWTRQEFRDWLSGAGVYTGSPQFATLDALNAEYSQGNALTNPRPAGFPFASWDAVQPPTDPLWNTTNRGRWWQKWQQFRIQQVANAVQYHQDRVIEAGWSPDRTYGHQIPWNPTSTSNNDRRMATPWTTTFTAASSNGITTYGTNAASNTIFSALYANDKNWGIFEYNRLSTDVATNRAAIDATWNNRIHVLTPYGWGGQELYRIQGGSAFETALRQFIFDQRENRYTGMNRWEAHPDSREVVWSMSRAPHVAGTNQIAGATMAGGRFSGTAAGVDPYLWLQLDATRPMESDEFQQLSLRMRLDQPIVGAGQLLWVDEADGVHQIDFLPVAGWHVYQVNLADRPEWRGRRIKALRLDIPAANGTGFDIDWVRLHATHYWPMDEAGEVHGAANISGVAVAGGMLTATMTNEDGHFYFSTDKSNPAIDADRVYIDARTHHVVRLRMESSAAGIGEIFWWTRNNPTPRSIAFPVTAGWREYEIDLAGQPGWQGQVTRLRLDPVNVPSATVRVDRLGVYTPHVTPRPLSVGQIANTSTPWFGWDAPAEAGGPVTHEFQLARDWAFADVVESVRGLTRPEHVYTQPTRLDGLHYWRVRTVVAGRPSPWSVPMSLFLRPWDFSRAGDVIPLNDLGPAVVAGGRWQATTTGGDPYLFFNSGHTDGAVIEAADWRALRLRMGAAGSGAALVGEVYVFRADGSFFSYPFPMLADGIMREYEVNLTADPRWSGTINVVRLDPANAAGVALTLDQAELVPTRVGALPLGDVDYPFDVPGDFLGWTADRDVADATVAGGSLQFRVTGPDPIFLTEGFTARPGNEFRYLLLRMRNTTDFTSAQVFWTTTTQPTVAAQRSITIPVSTGDTAVREYVIDMSTVPGWAGQSITGLRFDPVTNWTGGPDVVEVDRLAITREDPSTPPPKGEVWRVF